MDNQDFLQSEMETEDENRSDNDVNMPPQHAVNVPAQQLQFVVQDGQRPPNQQVVAAIFPHEEQEEHRMREANLQIVENNDEVEIIEIDPPPEQQVVAPIVPMDLAQLMEERRSLDYIEELRLREANFGNANKLHKEENANAGAPMHHVVDYMRDLNISFAGISPIKAPDDEDMILPIEAPNDEEMKATPKKKAYQDYSLEEMYADLSSDIGKAEDGMAMKKKIVKQLLEAKPTTKFGTKWTKPTCTLGLPSTSKPCTCSDCSSSALFNRPKSSIGGFSNKQPKTGQIDSKRRKSAEYSDKGHDVVSGGGRKCYRRKEAMEVPIHHTEKNDIHALSICKPNRVFCNCGYCTVRKTLNNDGHHDNKFHRSRCVHCHRVATTKNPQITPIVAVYHVFQDEFFEMEDLNTIKVELITMLAKAMDLRISVFVPTIAYIDREHKVVAGREVRRFVLAIRSECMAQKLNTLVNKLDLTDFMIFQTFSAEFEDQQRLLKMGSLQEYVMASAKNGGDGISSLAQKLKERMEKKPTIEKKSGVTKKKIIRQITYSSSSEECEYPDDSDSDYEPADGESEEVDQEEQDDEESEQNGEEELDESPTKSEENEDEEDTDEDYADEEESDEDEEEPEMEEEKAQKKENVRPTGLLKVVAPMDKALKRRHFSEEISDDENKGEKMVRQPIPRRNLDPKLLTPYPPSKRPKRMAMWNSLFDEPKSRKPLVELGHNQMGGPSSNFFGKNENGHNIMGPSTSSGTPISSMNVASSSVSRGLYRPAGNLPEVEVITDEEPEIECLD